MKSIKSRYSLKNINSDYYCGVDLAKGEPDSGSVTILKKDSSGYIHAPYITIDSTPTTTSWIYNHYNRNLMQQELKQKINKLI